MNEGGQSSTGQLLDFMIDTHPASAKLKETAKAQGTNIFALLTDLLDEMVKDKKVPFMSYLTKDMYLYPDLHGAFSRSFASFSLEKRLMHVSSVEHRQPITSR